MAINVIGLTGPSGAGKSEFCRLISKRAVPYIDADKVYHSLLTPDSPCTAALAAEFGSEILDGSGTPDRKKLGEIVFSSKERLERLNSIVLHFVIENIKTTIAALDAAGVKNIIIDAPTLIESGFHLECDVVISVISSKESRIKRICARDGITEEAARKRVDSQHPDEFYTEHSDIVISNDSDAEELSNLAADLLLKILK